MLEVFVEVLSLPVLVFCWRSEFDLFRRFVLVLMVEVDLVVLLVVELELELALSLGFGR